MDAEFTCEIIAKCAGGSAQGLRVHGALGEGLVLETGLEGFEGWGGGSR